MWTFLLTLLSPLAFAADLTSAEPDALASMPGLVAVEFSQPGACPTSPWDASSFQVASQGDIALRQVERDTRSVQILLEGAPRARAMILAWKDGARLDAICDCVDTETLDAWLRGLPEQRTYADLVTLPSSSKLDITALMEVARRQHCANHATAAFDTLASLWERIPLEDPDQRVLRFTRIARDMAMLASGSPEVTARLEALRDALDEAKNTDDAALEDWIALNRMLKDDARTFAWFEASASVPERASLMAWQAPNYFDMLITRERWADAGRLVDDATAWLKRDIQLPGTTERLKNVYAALLASGQKKQAAAYLKTLLATTSAYSGCDLAARAVLAGAEASIPKALTRDCPTP